MKKLKKIANKPIKSMKNAGTERIRTFCTPLKPLIKTPKSEVFISFNMEFKLKYYRKSPKTIIIYC